MMKQKNKTLFFETPKDKLRVFQKPKLVVLSEGTEVESWDNTQPLYFYPFSWLDFLEKKVVRELYIYDCLPSLAEKEIKHLDKGKVHFEKLDMRLMRIAKERGHKVSIICNLEELTQEQIEELSNLDFVKIRVSKDYGKLSLLSNLPNERVLSCIKTYLGEGCDYRNVTLQSKEMGFDFFHVAKRLVNGPENPKVSKEEKKRVMELLNLEARNFKVVIPSSLDEIFARRFLIAPQFSNTSSCHFSRYRIVLKGDVFYPCYTQRILAQEGFRKGELRNPTKDCLDCACIYENDMLFDIESKMEKYKKPYFALEYQDDK